jgi:hypothetical protein
MRGVTVEIKINHGYDDRLFGYSQGDNCLGKDLLKGLLLNAYFIFLLFLYLNE